MKTLFTILLLVAVVFALSTARIGDGIAWDFGGYDTELGFFICPASGSYDDDGTYIIDWENPLAPIFPELVTDC